jgi:hypothetical protein
MKTNATHPLTSAVPLRSSFSAADGDLTDFWSGCAGSGDCDAMIAIRGAAEFNRRGETSISKTDKSTRLVGKVAMGEEDRRRVKFVIGLQSWQPVSEVRLGRRDWCGGEGAGIR